MGSCGRYAGRRSATFSRSTVIDRSQPIRSAITVAGIVASSLSCSRIASSASSAIEPLGARRYRGTSCARSARRTVFFEIPQKHDYPSKAHRRSYARRTGAERGFATTKDPATSNFAAAGAA